MHPLSFCRKHSEHRTFYSSNVMPTDFGSELFLSFTAFISPRRGQLLKAKSGRGVVAPIWSNIAGRWENVVTFQKSRFRILLLQIYTLWTWSFTSSPFQLISSPSSSSPLQSESYSCSVCSSGSTSLSFQFDQPVSSSSS